MADDEAIPADPWPFAELAGELLSMSYLPVGVLIDHDTGRFRQWVGGKLVLDTAPGEDADEPVVVNSPGK